MRVKKILIIRFSSIGDIVLTSPVIRCLKMQSGGQIHFVTKAKYKSILVSSPYIEKVHSFSKNLHEIIPELKQEKIDLIIDLHKNIRSRQLALALRCKSLSFDKINWQKWMMVNLKWNYLPPLHIVDRYMQTTEQLGIKNDGAGLDFFIPSEAELNLGDLGIQKENFLVIVIGAAHFTKRIPKSTIVGLCKQLSGEKIVLLGGADEEALGAEIISQTNGGVINMCGQLSLNQSASLLRQCGLLITSDTGLMHVGAAFQKKMIVMWGNTIPEFGMYPYAKNGVNNHINIEINGLSCRPCSKIGFQKCPKSHFKCMRLIKVEQIISAMDQLGYLFKYK